MTTDRRTVLVHADAGSLRRRLGQTAWVVLEELLACSTGASPNRVALATTRTLAGELLVGDAVTGRGPHGSDAVVPTAGVGDEQALVGAVGVGEPEPVHAGVSARLPPQHTAPRS